MVKTLKTVAENRAAAPGETSTVAGEMGGKGNAPWDKLESIFEERTARALGRLGVPAAKDLTVLAGRVAALEAAVAALTAEDAPKAAKVPKFKPGKALKAAVQATPPAPAARTARKKAAGPGPGVPRQPR